MREKWRADGSVGLTHPPTHSSLSLDCLGRCCEHTAVRLLVAHGGPHLPVAHAGGGLT